MKKTSLLQRNDDRTSRLPPHIAFLCALVCILLVASSLVEVWIMMKDWLNGEAFHKIYQGYSEAYPDLKEYSLSGNRIYIITLLLDYLAFVPYYVALMLTAVIFNRFRCGIFWDNINIKMLRAISILIIFDACFPTIKDSLQILAFTAQEKPLLILSYGISAEGVRSFIIGLAIYTFSVILSKAKGLEDENNLII